MPLVVNARSRPDPVLALVLCQLRTERGLSPDAVAERAGMTTAAYRQLEGSLSGPSWTTVRSIAEALGVSMGELGAAVDRESTPGELDRKAPESRKHVHRRAMLAVLIFAGLRLAEMLELRWHEVDLPAGWLNVEGTTTDQAVRRIKIRGALHDELLASAPRPATRAPAPTCSRARAASGWAPRTSGNRVFAGSVRDANKSLERAKLSPLPEKLTPQSLRRTFASLLYALGESPPVVMAEMGHADAGLALRIYAQAMRRDEGERGKLRAMVEGSEFTPINADGTESAQTMPSTEDIQTGESA